MSIYKKILDLFETQSEMTVKEIVHQLDASKQMVHISLNRLLEEDKIEKFGKVPKTFYRNKKVEEKK